MHYSEKPFNRFRWFYDDNLCELFIKNLVNWKQLFTLMIFHTHMEKKVKANLPKINISIKWAEMKVKSFRTSWNSAIQSNQKNSSVTQLFFLEWWLSQHRCLAPNCGDGSCWKLHFCNLFHFLITSLKQSFYFYFHHFFLLFLSFPFL
jgi:hypothetical protein